jgi:hypothetical protein
MDAKAARNMLVKLTPGRLLFMFVLALNYSQGCRHMFLLPDVFKE